jgi:hypothetical protein
VKKDSQGHRRLKIGKSIDKAVEWIKNVEKGLIIKLWKVGEKV